jgi:uncharacterized protein (TIGR04141 family)
MSGELFQMDQEFRRKVAGKLPAPFTIREPTERPMTDQYQVVFAIISNAPGDLDIPFFSRLNLNNSARTLKGLGYRVAKHKIDVTLAKANFKKQLRKEKKN